MQRAALILGVATLSALGSVHVMRTLGAAEAAPVEQAASLVETPPSEPAPGGAASVRKAADGHYWAEAQVEGRRVRFLVDTGASSVALTEADARRLGHGVSTLAFDQPVSTAGGKVMAAKVTLDYVSVSGARVEDVEALVVREGLETSLLGMTYLGRLSRFEATRDALILRR
jgi:aspartyl protease family protein